MSSFLHEFYAYKQGSFFAVPPPESIEPEWRALLAGAAEFLCGEFRLEIPAWVNEPEFRLDEPWEPYAWLLSDEPGAYERRVAKAHPCFLKHNVVWESRGLIAL
jgi:hypothetical protein